MTPDTFDAGLRALHAASTDALSPATRGALQRAQRAALAGTPRHATARLSWQWPVAAGSFAVALAAVLLVRQPDVGTPAGPAIAAMSADESASPAATLDENPDLYLWLASNDAVAFASE